MKNILIFICLISPLIICAQGQNPPQNTNNAQPQTIPETTPVLNVGAQSVTNTSQSNNNPSATGNSSTTANSGTYTPSDDQPKGTLSGLLAYNFSSQKSGLKNLTPIINYGWNKEIDKTWGRYNLQINPYSAGQIDVEDSSAYMPALMLPGAVGINGKFSIDWTVGTGSEISLSPAIFGIKFIPSFSDSVSTIAQHNYRIAAGFKFEELFIIGAQFTFAWHNLTTESENIYKKLFSTEKTNLSYLMVSIQTKLTKQVVTGNSTDTHLNTYLYAEWRSVLNKIKYESFDNLKILTIGLRQDLSFDHISPGARASL